MGKKRTKKAPAFCVYLAYRLKKVGDRRGNVATGTLLEILLGDEEQVGNEEEIEVNGGEDSREITENNNETEVQKGKNLLEWVAKYEQENKGFMEVLDRLEHQRKWLERRIEAVEHTINNPEFGDNNIEEGLGEWWEVYKKIQSEARGHD